MVDTSGEMKMEPEHLTKRELHALRLMVSCYTTKSLALELCVSPSSAHHHVSAILSKLGVHSKTEAVVEGVKLGLVEIIPYCKCPSAGLCSYYVNSYCYFSFQKESSGDK